jgi:signal transduction histidine kinase
LRRGLSNLLDNAIAHAGAVTVRVEAADGRAVARIQDSGPGIPEADLERVFEPFFRLEASRNRTTGGAGLGLSIARHAVRAHGGDLTLANAPEGGLVATLSLPLIEAEAA